MENGPDSPSNLHRIVLAAILGGLYFNKLLGSTGSTTLDGRLTSL